MVAKFLAARALVLYFTALQDLSGATQIHAIPKDLFTCTDRVPGLYADVKRECAYFYECTVEGEMTHHICDYPNTVFDDRKGKCGPPELGMAQSCAANTGHFTDASTFCRGRPNSSNTQNQKFYPDHLRACESYFWCYKVGQTSFGVKIECPGGTRFDAEKQSCVDARKVPCGNEDLYPYNLQQAD